MIIFYGRYSIFTSERHLRYPTPPLLIKTRPPRPSKLRRPLIGSSTYRIHLIRGCISFHSCLILSPSETGFIVSAQVL